jgi:ubiquinone/menaquinone biosynthesis C-methylase UbiE
MSRTPIVAAGAAPRAAGYVAPSSLASIADYVAWLKTRAHDRLQPAVGQRLLDVGCGPGLDTAWLAPLVAPSGMVVGLDRDAGMIRAAGRGRRGRPAAAHLVGDGSALPFRSASFDGVRADRVLQHAIDPEALLAEMVRVTRPGGTVLCVDTDWASLSIDAADDQLERRIVGLVAEEFAQGYIGRQLARRLTGAGVDVTAIELCPVRWDSFDTFRRTSFPATNVVAALLESRRLSSDDWQRFVAALERTDADGVFFATATVVIVTGLRRSEP